MVSKGSVLKPSLLLLLLGPPQAPSLEKSSCARSARPLIKSINENSFFNLSKATPFAGPFPTLMSIGTPQINVKQGAGRWGAAAKFYALHCALYCALRCLLQGSLHCILHCVVYCIALERLAAGADFYKNALDPRMLRF